MSQHCCTQSQAFQSLHAYNDQDTNPNPKHTLHHSQGLAKAAKKEQQAKDKAAVAEARARQALEKRVATLEKENEMMKEKMTRWEAERAAMQEQVGWAGLSRFGFGFGLGWVGCGVVWCGWEVNIPGVNCMDYVGLALVVVSCILVGGCHGRWQRD